MYAAKIRAAENRSPNIKPTIPPENTENKSIYHVSNSNKLVHCTRERERVPISCSTKLSNSFSEPPVPTGGRVWFPCALSVETILVVILGSARDRTISG